MEIQREEASYPFYVLYNPKTKKYFQDFESAIDGKWNETVNPVDAHSFADADKADWCRFEYDCLVNNFVVQKIQYTQVTTYVVDQSFKMESKFDNMGLR